MGLKKSVLTKFGIHANEAYHRIKSIRGENGGAIKYEVDTFYNQSVRNSGAQPIESRTYDVPGELHSGINVITELYAILKANSDFANASDILDQGQEILQVAGLEVTNSMCYQCSLATQFLNVEHTSDLTGIEITGSFIYDRMLLIGTLKDVALSNIVWSYNSIEQATIQRATIDNAALRHHLAI